MFQKPTPSKKCLRLRSRRRKAGSFAARRHAAMFSESQVTQPDRLTKDSTLQMFDPMRMWRDPSNTPNQSNQNMNRRQFPSGSTEFERVNNKKPFPMEPTHTQPDRLIKDSTLQMFDPIRMRSGPSNTPNQSNQTMNQRQFPSGSSEFERVNNKKPFPVEPIRKFEGDIKIERMGKFPDLIVMNLHKGRVLAGVKLLQKSFADSPYGPLRVETVDHGFSVKSKLVCHGVCLAEAEGKKKLEAETKAAFSLLKSLRTTNYFIELKRSYFPAKKYRCPEFILNPDASQSHLYKVVCLNEPNGKPFIYPLSGAVHYVSSQEELWEYVHNHGRSGSKADLFILNIDKSKFKKSKEVCYNSDLVWKLMLGCSNRAVVASPEISSRELLSTLAREGGENIKYRLLLPGRDMDSEIKVEESDSEESDGFDGANFPLKENFFQKTENVKTEEDESFIKQNSGGTSSNTPENYTAVTSKTSVSATTLKTSANVSPMIEKNIDIDPWIQENLILMDLFNEHSELETPKEIIFNAVKSCPTLEEFIIEKKSDKNSGLITAEALIDRKLVGRASGFGNEVKRQAAENALENLKKCCAYIEVKRSYVGSLNVLPVFLRDKAPGFQNEYCRVVDFNRVKHKGVRVIRDLLVNNRFADFFFLDDFPHNTRIDISNEAKRCNLMVRRFGKNYVCVSKRAKPTQVYKDMMKLNITENEKYLLILPRGRSNAVASQLTSKNVKVEEDQSIKNLFDFQNKYSVMAQKEKPSFLKETGNNLSSYVEPKREEPSWSNSNNKRSRHTGANDKSELNVSKHFAGDDGSFRERDFGRNEAKGFFDPQTKALFDMCPLNSPTPLESERQQSDTNRFSYSEQARVETGWDKPRNVEPNSSLGHRVERGEHFPKHFAGGSQRFNFETRDLVEKNTDMNSYEPSHNQVKDNWAQDRERSVRGSEVEELMFRNPALDCLREMQKNDSDSETNFRHLFNTEFSQSISIFSSSQKETEQSAFRSDRREYDQIDRRHSDQNEPSRKRLSDRSIDWKESERSTHDTKRRDSRESNRNVFQKVAYNSEWPTNRSRERDISDDVERRSDSRYNRSRERDFSGDVERRSDFRYDTSRERDFSDDVERRSNSRFNLSRERNISGDVERRSDSRYNTSRERDFSDDVERRSNSRFNLSRERNISDDVERRSDSRFNRSRERDFPGDVERRSDSSYNRTREENYAIMFQRRSDFEESRLRETIREENTGFDNRKNHMNSEPDQYWTKTVKKLYDQRF